MRKLILAAAVAVTVLITGCATRHLDNGFMRASDPNVTQTATGTLLAMEEKRRSNLTVTNTAAGVVSATQGSSTLGLAAFALEVFDHENAKNKDRFMVVKIQDEVTGKEAVFVSDLLTLPKYANVGDRVRMIQQKYGAEGAYNLTRHPDYDLPTR
ncbi:hypothetical protein [Acidovorax sp. sic0104]|uniref:hypothetical protein n=1 Tax=Acidovorax sp. sic0104 TaxID=2854784 RepID=UPI001C4718F8|nr:hypothetical protein [Acidovorax sp. sic0104]MBV7542061.1 hypothetical protein [Acidovorax sp. sic0104]